MSEIFISYARSTEPEARRVAEALRALGYGVWRDDELPPHRAFADVIEERLKAAKAVVVLWSKDAAKSEWVQSEADRARADHKLVQLTLDGAPLPMPFDRIQCADLVGWRGAVNAPGWVKVVESVSQLAGPRTAAGAPPPEPTPQPSARSARSVAVLPFADLNRDDEQDALVDGIEREIASELTRHKELLVVPPSAVSALGGRPLSHQELARHFDVRYLLEGGVRTSGERVRVSVSLIDGADGTQIWADRFDDTLDDVFALQDRLAVEVVGRISSLITRAEINKAIAGRAANPTDGLVLRAYAEYFTFQRSGMRRAIELLDEAIALDPRYAMAMANSASARALSIVCGWSEDPEADRRLALEFIERAVDAAPDSARILTHAFLTLGNLHVDRARAEALAKRALAIGSGDSLVWQLSGVFRLVVGDLDLAEEHLLRALSMTPNDTITEPRGPLAICRLLQGRHREALDLVRDSTRPLPVNLATAAAVYGYLDMAAEAREALAKFRQSTPLGLEAFARGYFYRPQDGEALLEGLRRAEALVGE